LVSYLLDTNACIRVLTGRSSALTERLRARDPREIKLCSVVKAELLAGARKSGRPAENLRVLADFFAPFEAYGFDDSCAEHYGVVRSELERQGTPIGPNDLLIAATALRFDATLVTHNIVEFGRVAKLRVEDWETAETPRG
jgi:tRNA(fMet)-specific endonuclease VapC